MGDTVASIYKNFKSQTKPSPAAKPAKGPKSPTKERFCQPCFKEFGSKAPMNANCRPAYNTRQHNTEPTTAKGMPIALFLASPANSTPCLKPVKAKATPPEATAARM